MLELSHEDLPVPKGIQDGQFTTIVWDNIDFGRKRYQVKAQLIAPMA